MLSSFIRNGIFLSCVLLMPGFLLAQGSGDTVHLLTGAPLRGTITAMSPDEITVTTPAGARPISTSEIRYIIYQDEPNELSSGRRAIYEKNYNQAFEELKKAQTDANTREVIVQDVVYFRALAAAKLAMGEGGDKAKATELMLDFVRKFRGSSSYHFYESAEVLGDLAMSSGDFDEATKYYKVIIEKAKNWPEFQMRATLADGRALAAQKNYDEAKKRFSAVATSSLNTQPAQALKTMAEVGVATCTAESGKPDDAIKTLQTIIEKNDPKDTELFARAYVALGRAYVQANKPKDAILAFLAVDLLYFGESEAHAEALSNLTKLWEQVGRADRAVAARNTLRERYAGSIWAK